MDFRNLNVRFIWVALYILKINIDFTPQIELNTHDTVTHNTRQDVLIRPIR